jgi:hypothetical protein
VLGGAIAGNEFKAGGQATAAIDVADSTCKGVVIQGNNFNDWNGYGVVASGTGSLTNVEIGINRALAPTTGVWNNSFTPLIAFGGAAVGITYGSQFGRWQRSGDYIEWTLRVVLTSKGSSTGTLRITGLPVASSSVSNNDISFAVFASGLTGVTGGIAGYHASNQSSLRLWYTGTGTATELTDATFTNSTEIYASGKYFAPVN